MHWLSRLLTIASESRVSRLLLLAGIISMLLSLSASLSMFLRSPGTAVGDFPLYSFICALVLLVAGSIISYFEPENKLRSKCDWGLFQSKVKDAQSSIQVGKHSHARKALEIPVWHLGSMVKINSSNEKLVREILLWYGTAYSRDSTLPMEIRREGIESAKSKLEMLRLGGEEVGTLRAYLEECR